MFQECKHKDRLMHAITNMEKEPDLFYEALENFRKYGAATANDTQVGGQHYKAKTIQPWDFIAANGLGYFEGNIVKYVSRWRDKGGLDDLRKARHYLDKLIELEENAA